MAGNRNEADQRGPEVGPNGRYRRVSVAVHGIVQGVGFRPTVYQLAGEHRLQGWVRNQSSGVELEVAGAATAVAGFLRDLRDKAPPLAKIVEVVEEERPYAPMEPFHIVQSQGNRTRLTLISPDVCTCPDCFREFQDPADRRYRYPFINCTNCGPRYTIVWDVPYDRDRTTMAPFAMCPDCNREYSDPKNRRFHAQPNACWNCGPQVRLEASNGTLLAERDDAVRETVRLLETGAIVAIKGLGGFHLAVRATDQCAVERLRGLKIREEKPFAVMFDSLAEIDRICRTSDRERQLLVSRERPIVLLQRRPVATAGGPIVAAVAPGNRYLGAFLPYTPLHHLLFTDSAYRCLVMTSGNRSDEPIVTTNDEARKRLRGIADYFLLHDRAIHIRCDDSVVRVVNNGVRPLRRARGYVPVPVFLKDPVASVLAVGAELKNTICLTRGREAFLSQHIGDLENLETLHAFEFNIEHLQRILDIRPQLVVHDLHPDYLSSQWAERQTGWARLAVQHHQAHIAAVIAERHIEQPVLGLALDGTGYGTDGTIWGGELLRVDPFSLDFERLARFRHLRLPGGNKAIREPWRMALSVLFELDSDRPEETFSDLLDRWPERATRIVLQMLRQGINSPITSSCGRVFDAVSALIGLRQRIHYEGQAAIELEQAIVAEAGFYPGTLARDGPITVIDPLPMIRQVVGDLRNHTAVGVMAARFHNGLVRLLADAVNEAGARTGIAAVALSGGVFQNAYLAARLETALTELGFQAFVHHQVPANDACIALGQAWLGACFLKGRGADRS